MHEFSLPGFTTGWQGSDGVHRRLRPHHLVWATGMVLLVLPWVSGCATFSIQEASPDPVRQPEVAFQPLTPADGGRPAEEELIASPPDADYRIKSIREVTPRIAPPVELDPEGRPLPGPDDYADYASDVFAEHGMVRHPSVPVPDRLSELHVAQDVGFCHRPLYFEQFNLERYGHSFGLLQPAFSAAHFYSTVFILPYKVAVEPPRICTYPAGDHPPPGTAAPWQRRRLPVQAKAGLAQAGTLVGLIFLIP